MRSLTKEPVSGTTADVQSGYLNVKSLANRWLLAAIVAILVVACVVAAIVRQRSPEVQENVAHAATPAADKPCLQFFDQSAALSFTKEREPIAHHSYTVSNGNMIERTYFYYRSTKIADKNLAANIGPTDNILTREPKLDENDKVIGKRLVAQLKDNRFEIRWTEGSNLIVISGTHLDDLLEFERPRCP